MVFVIKGLKYDTYKLEFISDKCKYSYVRTNAISGTKVRFFGKNVKLYKSQKGNWLLTYEADNATVGVSLTEDKAKEYLIRYDIDVYEKIFGEIEEA